LLSVCILMIFKRRRQDMLVDKKFVSVKFSETKLKKRHKALAVLYDIANDLTSSLGLLEILDRAILKVKEHFKADVVRIYLMDNDKQCLELAAYKGLTKKELMGLHTRPLGQGFTGKAARTKSFIAQRVSELQNGERTLLLQHVGLKVIICVPLIVKNQVVGVMNLGSKRMVSLNQEKIDLLVAIGNQIAVAVNVSKLYEDVSNKAEKIQKKKEQLEFFAYTIAHDLKNPAIGVAGFVKLLAEKDEEKLDERGNKYCQQIMQAAQEIDSVTKDINEYIVSKKVSLNFERTDIGNIARQIKEDLSEVLNQRSITLSGAEIMPEVVADASAITRVFKNLIGNALKHGGKNLTRITIDYDEDEQYHIFSINNDGEAMKKNESDVIFEMFQKLPNSKGSEGSGLGLAIVKEIVNAHKGKTWFDSNPKRGTTFYVAISKFLRT